MMRLLALSQHLPEFAAAAGELPVLGAMFDCAIAVLMPAASSAAEANRLSLLSVMTISSTRWQHCRQANGRSE
jgi:hypothetical protein